MALDDAEQRVERDDDLHGRADVNIAASPPAQAGLDVPVAEGLPVLAVDPVELLVVYNRLKSRTSRPKHDEVP